MDPLSDVLSLLKPRSYMFGGFDAGGDWSIRFGQHEGIKCYAVVSGQGWLLVESVSDAVRLTTGDCFVLPRGWPFVLTSNPSLSPIDYRQLFPTRPNGSMRVLNNGGDFSIVGGHFTLTGGHVGVLLAMLPPIVHIRTEADRESLRWCMERMRQELRERQPGGFLIAQQLAYTMLVQALRLHLAEGVTGGVGWLFALADRQMAVAITAMHEDPAHRWTLASLAERAGMSRTTFTLKFKETVGTSPMDYLTRWRMMVAGERLTHSSDSISVIALSLGYESESAFSTAFKRMMGCSPRQYGRGADPAASFHDRSETVGADRREAMAS